jgi:hypothetical protein
MVSPCAILIANSVASYFWLTNKKLLLKSGSWLPQLSVAAFSLSDTREKNQTLHGSFLIKVPKISNKVKPHLKKKKRHLHFLTSLTDPGLALSASVPCSFLWPFWPAEVQRPNLPCSKSSRCGMGPTCSDSNLDLSKQEERQCGTKMTFYVWGMSNDSAAMLSQAE